MVSSTFTFLFHLILSLPLNPYDFIIILLDPCCAPRYRWDQLLVLAWRAFLPLVLVGVFFVTFIFVSNLTFFQNPSDISEMFNIAFFSLYLKNNLLIKRMIRTYFIFILYIRSFFLEEKPEFIYGVSILLFLIKYTYPNSISFFQVTYIWLALGVNLIFVDLLGSQISNYALSEHGLWFTTYLTITLKNSSLNMKRHIGFKAASALIIGKTPMTATGRATLTVGFITGCGWLYNERLNRIHQKEMAAEQRVHQEQEAIKQRVHQEQEAAKQRAYDFYKQQHEKWENKRFNKGTEPKYDEEMKARFK